MLSDSQGENRAALLAVFVAKTARTFCYGFLGVALPVYLHALGVRASGVGIAVALTLAGSAALTWAVRRPAERWGARAALEACVALSVAAALLFLLTRTPWLVVLAAMLGNVAMSTGESGPFLALEQVLVTRAVPEGRRTHVLSLYNLAGYAAAALGALIVGAGLSLLFGIFLAGALVQAHAYAWLPRGGRLEARGARATLPSAPLIRRLAGLFALDAFAGGFVLQALVAYFLTVRFGLDLHTLGLVFFVTQILTAASLLLASPAAARFGLLPTMVVSHLASNGLLIAIAVAPTAWIAVALLFSRHLLSQIDVPTRQAYLMAIVEDRDREAASTTTTLARTVAQTATPAVTGWVMQAVALSAPFALGGGLKIVYDVLLWLTFRDVPLRAEER